MFSHIDMHGKTVLVTGATSGIGKEAARALAQRGATVILVGRSPQRIEATLAEIKADAPEGRVQVAMADLESQEQIHALAGQIKGAYDRLDVLINNAGASFHRRAETEDGIEKTFALNHLSYFLLTNLLLDLLKASAPARIVNVASGEHARGHLNFDDLELRHGYTNRKAYTQSKLANVLFTRELARRLDGTGVTVNALNPGPVATNLWKGTGPIIGTIAGLLKPLMRTPQKGAETVVYLATSPDVAEVSGAYFMDCAPRTPSAESQDDASAARLWDVSEQMTRTVKTRL